MNTAAVFLSKKEIFVHSYAKAKAGYSIAAEPFFKFDRNVSHTDLVRAIKSALESNKETVANPDFSELNSKIANAFGIKSATVLDRSNIKCCDISLKEKNILRIMPTKHAIPPDKGYSHKPDESICINYSSTDEEIMNALNLALSKCV